jgi:hypothetical protein
VNPISAVVWSWRTLRGHSITFAALFGLSILGVSIVSSLRHLLSRGGAPWFIWLGVPMVLVTILAKKETSWMPEPAERKKWARRIFFGSIGLALVIAYFRPTPPPPAGPPSPAPRPASEPFHKVPR